MNRRRSVVALLALGAASSGCAALLPSEDPRPIVRGPFPTRVMLPQALVFPEPRPRRPLATPVGAVTGGVVASYVSIFESARVAPDEVDLDAEVLHTAVTGRFGLETETDVEVELAASFASSGFMDAFVDTFHELLGLPDGARDEVPRDQYALRLGRSGVTAWERSEDEVEFMDLPVRITRVLRRPEGGLVGLALRAGVELPTGDEAAGTGSGGVDWDLGLILERSRGRWTLSGGIDLVLVDPGQSFRAAGIIPDDIWIGTFGAEYRWNDRMSCLLGLRARTPFTDDIEIKEADRPILDLALGVAGDAGSGRWFWALHEDLIADSGPDVAFSVGYQLAR